VPSIDEILASSPLAGLQRVSPSGGDRQVALVQLAENFTDLDRAPAASLVVLSRSASVEVSDYRLDMALRWAAIHDVAAVAAFSDQQWEPTITARTIACTRPVRSVSGGTEMSAMPARAAMSRAVMVGSQGCASAEKAATAATSWMAAQRSAMSRR